MFFDILEASMSLSIVAFCAVGIWAIVKLTNRSTFAMKSLFLSLIDSVPVAKALENGEASDIIAIDPRLAVDFAKELKQKVNEL